MSQSHGIKRETTDEVSQVKMEIDGPKGAALSDEIKTSTFNGLSSQE